MSNLVCTYTCIYYKISVEISNKWVKKNYTYFKIKCFYCGVYLKHLKNSEL